MKLKRAAAAMLAAVMLISAAAGSAMAGITDDLLAIAEDAKDTAAYYEDSGNYGYAYSYIKKYVETMDMLYIDGAVSEADFVLAESWLDSMKFAPSLYLSDGDGGDIYFGSDGLYVPGVSACKIPVPFGASSVSNFLTLIPPSTNELCVLVSLTPIGGESMLRAIAFGNMDAALISELKIISRIEGQIYLSFSPSPDLRQSTRTIAQSFIQAFRHVSSLARRYAPNAKLVYTVSDTRYADECIFETFYPGDGYFDAIGVEMQNERTLANTPKALEAFNCQGAYYDPLMSVMRVAEDARKVTGQRDIPLIIESCSFPWDGKASVDGYADAMRRFYTLLPAVCPQTKAVFYSNVSSADGICNLRQNPDALAVYTECSKLPYYINYGTDGNGRGHTNITELTEIESVTPGTELFASVLCSGRYAASSYRIFLDGEEVINGKITLTAGTHRISYYTLYARNKRSKTEYEVTVTESGVFTCELVRPEFDLNGNGIYDFGDSELLMFILAGWNVKYSGSADVDGDGELTPMDAALLERLMIP